MRCDSLLVAAADLRFGDEFMDAGKL